MQTGGAHQTNAIWVPRTTYELGWWTMPTRGTIRIEYRTVKKTVMKMLAQATGGIMGSVPRASEERLSLEGTLALGVDAAKE